MIRFQLQKFGKISGKCEYDNIHYHSKDNGFHHENCATENQVTKKKNKLQSCDKIKV